MTLGLAFYILMLIWLVLGWPAGVANATWRTYAPSLLIFVLFLLLGWKVFGPPIHG